MKTGWLKLISVIVPYVAVLVGLYVLKSAWIAIGLYHFGMAVFLINGNRKRLIRKVYAGWNWLMAAAGVVMAAVLFFVILFLWEYMELEEAPLHLALVNFGLHGTSWFLFMIYFSTVHPFLEELYWRGHLECGQGYFSWTDFAFAGYHILVLVWFIKLPWLIIVFIVLTAAACIWRYLVSRLGGMVVVLLSHVAADISVIAAAYVLIQ